MVFGSLRAKSSSGLVSAATSMRSTMPGLVGQLLQAVERQENAVVGFIAGRNDSRDFERLAEDRDGLPGVQPLRRATPAPTMHSSGIVRRPAARDSCHAGLTSRMPVILSVAVRRVIGVGEPDAFDMDRAILRGERRRKSGDVQAPEDLFDIRHVGDPGCSWPLPAACVVNRSDAAGERCGACAVTTMLAPAARSSRLILSPMVEHDAEHGGGDRSAQRDGGDDERFASGRADDGFADETEDHQLDRQANRSLDRNDSHDRLRSCTAFVDDQRVAFDMRFERDRVAAAAACRCVEITMSRGAVAADQFGPFLVKALRAANLRRRRGRRRGCGRASR